MTPYFWINGKNVTTTHARFIKFTRRSDINFKGTVHRDDVDGLVYKTTRVLEETYQRRVTFFVAYRRLVYANGTRSPED